MVAPKPGAPRRVKWRNHCSTCGVVFDAPQTWAYCSKDCERSRRGRDPSESAGADAWLDPIYEERLRLRRELEDTPRYLHDGVLARLAANEQREAAMREQLAATVADRTSAAFWSTLVQRDADRFETSLRKSLGFAIRLGRRLCEAKAALEHGEFGRLFSDHPNPVDGALTFSSRWAQKLMALGGHEAIVAKAKCTSDLASLPASIETVYVLSRLPAPELEAAIARGDVRPDMRHADARRLLPVEPDDHDDAADAQLDDEIGRVLAPVRAQLVAFAADRPRQLRELKARLKAILRTLEACSESAGTELMTGPERADMRPMHEIAKRGSDNG